MRIGIIADTHGVLHPRLPEVFAGVDHIVHAGDVGGEHVLRSLRAIAPVTFVSGNNDGDSDGTDVVRITLSDLRILLTHILPRPSKLRAPIVESLRRERADVVIFGHSHLPHHETIGGVTFFNPASAGPRRFDYPTAVGILEALPCGAAFPGRAGARPEAQAGKPAPHEVSFRHLPLDERSVAALAKRMNQMR